MNEAERINKLLDFERKLQQKGYNLIVGIDEAGRGPLAGPVIAAACILPEKFDLPGLNDSKKLSAKKREYLFLKIQEQALAYFLGSASPEEIDKLNILRATKLAMKRALSGLAIKPDYVLIDGRDQLDIPFHQKNIINGDALCAGIAAASILAKVTRDEQMCAAHEIYPEYRFDRHKGYPTALHIEIVKRIGPCPLHRLSFAPLKEMMAVSQKSS